MRDNLRSTNLLTLGIDPGSITTGWALLKSNRNKVTYVDSGVLKFNSKTDFLNRLTEIKLKTEELIQSINPDDISLESLIYVKSPTALIKLAQTRGVILSAMVEKFEGRIFEYSPNLVKSSAVGHGHADKASVKKVLDMLIGKRDYETHDESDAVAVALCHILNRGKVDNNSNKTSRKASGMAGSLAHKIKG